MLDRLTIRENKEIALGQPKIQANFSLLFSSSLPTYLDCKTVRIERKNKDL